MSGWQKALIAAFEQHGQLRASEIGAIVGCYGPDAVTRAKSAGLPIVVVGLVPHEENHNVTNPFKRGPRSKIYALDPAKWPAPKASAGIAAGLL